MAVERVRMIYGEPLLRALPDSAQTEEIKQLALERVAQYALEEIKKEIRRSSWKGSPEDLIESFSYEVEGSSVRIKSTHPATSYVDKGVHPHQMIYLEKADDPIPIITDEGELIFRSATSQSMEDGSWYHPGFKGKHFLRRGVENARERLKEELVSFYKQALLEMIKDL